MQVCWCQLKVMQIGCLVRLTIEGNCLKEEHESHEEGELVSPVPIRKVNWKKFCMGTRK